MTKNEVPVTFKEWICKFKGVDLPIGDLAEYIARDLKFPEEDYFYETLCYISSSSNGDWDVLEAFTLAWSYYIASEGSPRLEPFCFA